MSEMFFLPFDLRWFIVLGQIWIFFYIIEILSITIGGPLDLKYSSLEPYIINYFHKESCGPNYNYFRFLLSFWLIFFLRKLYLFLLNLFLEEIWCSKQEDLYNLLYVMEYNLIRTVTLSLLLIVFLSFFYVILYYIVRILFIAYFPKHYMMLPQLLILNYFRFNIWTLQLNLNLIIYEICYILILLLTL